MIAEDGIQSGVTDKGDAAPPELRWVRTEVAIGRETFELRVAGKAVGTVRCHGLLVAGGEAETDDGCWTFKPDGILRSRLKISRAASNDAVATYEGRALRGALRGILRFAGGRQLHWLKERGWGQSWCFATEHGESIVRFQDRAERGVVSELGDAAASEPELTLLLVLGFYLRRLSLEDDRAETKREERRKQRKALQQKVARSGFGHFFEQKRDGAPPAPPESRWDRFTRR